MGHQRALQAYAASPVETSHLEPWPMSTTKEDYQVCAVACGIQYGTLISAKLAKIP